MSQSRAIRTVRPFASTKPATSSAFALACSLRRLFGAPVARIDHLGSFACRNIGGEAGGRRSEHASANALDVAGFVLANGRTVRVARDWDTECPAGRFLREAHAGACRFWIVVLGPDYNAAHRDHLHLDRGAFRTCR